ncbi:MAG TPA: hypothetical protein VFT01_02650 [Homoserinimonas sp.]|nr:hypothetical protein [Homoserinimonas sp.]
MSTTTDDPDELHALAALAMEHAFRSIQPRGPLWPFAFVEHEDGIKLIRAVGDRLEDMLAHTKRLVLEGPSPARAVLAWDGYSSHTGRRMDTIFVDAFEGGSNGGILIAQPYRSMGLVRKRNEPVGEPGIVERGRPPLF